MKNIIIDKNWEVKGQKWDKGNYKSAPIFHCRNKLILCEAEPTSTLQHWAYYLPKVKKSIRKKQIFIPIQNLVESRLTAKTLRKLNDSQYKSRSPTKKHNPSVDIRLPKATGCKKIVGEIICFLKEIELGPTRLYPISFKCGYHK